MKNVMYRCKTGSDDRKYIEAYRSTRPQNGNELLSDNLSEFSNDDLMLLYMDNGYENFYKEKEAIEHGMEKFQTFNGICEMSGDYGTFVEKIRDEEDIRLSPFVGTSEILLDDDAEIDCRGAFMRKIQLTTRGERYIVAYITDATMGSYITVSGYVNDASRCDVYIKSSVLSVLAGFKASVSAFIHIDDVDNGLPFELDWNMDIYNLCIAYKGVYDMMLLKPNSALCRLKLECEGYVNVAEWLVRYSGILCGAMITNWSGRFLDEFDNMECTDNEEDYIPDDYACIVRLPEGMKEECSKIYNVMVDGEADTIIITYRNEDSCMYAYVEV